MPKKNVFVPRARPQNSTGGTPRALLGRIFVALSIGVIFVLILSFIWKQNAQPPIGDEGDAGKPKLFREIPKRTVPEPQVLSMDKVATAPAPASDTARMTTGQQDHPGTQGASSFAPGLAPPTGTGESPIQGTLGAGTPSAPDPRGHLPAISPGAPSPTAGAGQSSAPPKQARADKTSSAPETASSSLSQYRPQSAAPATQKPSAAGDSAISWAYAVQVGAYSKKENAHEALERLKKFGFQPELTPFHHPRLGPLYAVRIAPFASQAEAQKIAQKIAEQEKDKPIIVKVPRSSR